MRIMAFVEGASESGEGSGQDGAVTVLLRRLLEVDVDITFIPTQHSGRKPGKHGPFTAKAINAMIVAEQRGFDAVVFLVDSDGDLDRVRQLDDAHASPLARIPRAMGVAIQEFEAWLLADEQAIREGLKAFDETDDVEPVRTQPDPESTKDAKAALEAIVGRRSKRKLYACIVQHLDFDLVASRCSRGFGVFRQRVLALKGG